MPNLSENELVVHGIRVHYETHPSGRKFSVEYGAVQNVSIHLCMEEFQKITPPRADRVLAFLTVYLGEHKFSWEEDIKAISLILDRRSLTCEFIILTGVKIEYDKFRRLAISVAASRELAIDSIRPIVNERAAGENERSASEWQVIIRCKQYAMFRDLFQMREELSRVTYIADTHGDDENLLFRFYVPSGRLYANEADRLLSLFRDWLTGVGRYSVRQDGYRTGAGQVYEFYGDQPLNRQELSQKFVSFLTMCAENPSAAAASLSQSGFDRSSAEAVVARYSKEIRRLRLDLRHERESRLLAIRHSLESDFVDSGLDSLQWDQIGKFIQDLVPEVADIAPTSLLALSNATSMSPSITINQQIIRAVESTVIQSIQGTTNIGTQASELLGLIAHFGGQNTQPLESAVYEFEDPDARPSSRRRAKTLLKSFLLQLGGKIEDATLTALAKYLEMKMGI